MCLAIVAWSPLVLNTVFIGHLTASGVSSGMRPVAPDIMRPPLGPTYLATAGAVTLVTGPSTILTPSSSSRAVAEAVATLGSLRSSLVSSWSVYLVLPTVKPPWALICLTASSTACTPPSEKGATAPDSEKMAPSLSVSVLLEPVEPAPAASVFLAPEPPPHAAVTMAKLTTPATAADALLPRRRLVDVDMLMFPLLIGCTRSTAAFDARCGSTGPIAALGQRHIL